MRPSRHFDPPGVVDRVFNRLMGSLLRMGVGPGHMRVLEVRGRRTGKVRSLPVDLLDRQGALYLVAPRGRAQWVRNAETQGEVTLRRGRESARYRLRALADAEKPEVLKAYLDRFHREVQRFFPVRAGSAVEAFGDLIDRYPAFELLPRPDA